MAPKRETAVDAWGKELAHAIDTAGMQAKQFAEAMHAAPSTISQWINARRTPHLDDVRRCDKVLGTNGYLARYYERWVIREIPTEWADRWLKAEAHANLLHNFEISVIPGLLQTERYAEAIMQVARHSTLDPKERTRRRMERQKVLTDENPPMCVFVIDEYALHRLVGSPEIMIEQLTHLCDLTTRSNIVVKIVPLGAEYYSALPFMIARLDGVELANLDTTLRGQVMEENGDVTEVNKIWEDIREAALPSTASLELIKEVTKEWEQK